jgi:hypothetical protein
MKHPSAFLHFLSQQVNAPLGPSQSQEISEQGNLNNALTELGIQPPHKIIHQLFKTLCSHCPSLPSFSSIGGRDTLAVRVVCVAASLSPETPSDSGIA